MATMENQQTWVPYETTKDCSQGFCSIYCPQWCYVIFPPPPPFGFSSEDSSSSSSGPNFSPLVIAVIGILVSAFLLVGYYTVISKYCGNLDSLRRWLSRHPGGGGGGGDHDPDDPNAGGFGHDAWHVSSASDGLDESVVKSIAVCRYRRGDGLVEGTDCSVCLNEFREDESLRLLPKCSHAFHVPCIDTWLKSHSNCPLCRANIVSAAAAAPPPLPPQLPAPPASSSHPPVPEIRHDGEIVAVVEDLERGREEEAADSPEIGGAAVSKDHSWVAGALGRAEEKSDIIELRRSVSMNSSCRSRVLMADMLGTTTDDDDDYNNDDDNNDDDNDSPETDFKGSGGSRALHCVINPVPMKRSFSSGRFCFTRQGKGNNAILPI